jgi:hypothetical protein
MSEVNVPLQNTPMHSRSTAPDGWTTLWISDPTTVAKHLCEACSEQFTNFMVKTLRSSTDVHKDT